MEDFRRIEKKERKTTSVDHTFQSSVLFQHFSPVYILISLKFRETHFQNAKKISKFDFKFFPQME